MPIATEKPNSAAAAANSMTDHNISAKRTLWVPRLRYERRMMFVSNRWTSGFKSCR